jgi:hypothetical protein
LEERATVAGFALERAARMAEPPHDLPFRGLVRAATLAEARLAPEDRLCLTVEAGAEGARVALALPDACSPASLGLGEDARALSLGLLSLSMSRA